MILVDTSVIVAWMDPSHPEHRVCSQALDFWAGRDQLAVSSVTYAEQSPLRLHKGVCRCGFSTSGKGVTQ